MKRLIFYVRGFDDVVRRTTIDCCEEDFDANYKLAEAICEGEITVEDLGED